MAQRRKKPHCGKSDDGRHDAVQLTKVAFGSSTTSLNDPAESIEIAGSCFDRCFVGAGEGREFRQQNGEGPRLL